MHDLVHLSHGNRQYLIQKWLISAFREANDIRRIEMSHIVIDNGVVIKNRYGQKGAQ